MFKIGDKVVYKRNVCTIKNIELNKFSNKECYILIPIDDKSLKITVPLDLEKDIRYVINKEEVEKIILNIPNIKVIDNMNEKNIENEYKRLLENLSFENLIKIIKTSYLRNERRVLSKKKISDKDDMYFKLAEKLLYTEFSIALNKSFDDTKEYVLSKVSKEVGENNEIN